VLPNRVHPDKIWELRVSHANVSRDALCEANASPVAEHSRHVRDDVLAVLMIRRELGNAYSDGKAPALAIRFLEAQYVASKG
jgi:hypothetical protein